MGNVKYRYLRHSAAGDQYVGRAASGIPVVDEKFAVSPPYFDASQKEGTTEIEVQVEVDRVVDSICSPDASHNLKKVLKCYWLHLPHHDWINNNIPSKHPI